MIHLGQILSAWAAAGSTHLLFISLHTHKHTHARTHTHKHTHLERWQTHTDLSKTYFNAYINTPHTHEWKETVPLFVIMKCLCLQNFPHNYRLVSHMFDSFSCKYDTLSWNLGIQSHMQFSFLIHTTFFFNYVKKKKKKMTDISFFSF